MLRMFDHDGVREFALSTRLSRAVGIKVSVFVVRGTLVDAGFWRTRHEFASMLATHPVKHAILTHWHEDHSGNLSLLVERRIPTLVSALTLARLPETRSLPLYRWAIWGSAPEVNVPPPTDPCELETLPTPGHSEDHVAVWDPHSETVFGGDLFLGVRACTAHASEDPYATLASIRRIGNLQPRRFFDAHRGPSATRSKLSPPRPIGWPPRLGRSSGGSTRVTRTRSSELGFWVARGPPLGCRGPRCRSSTSSERCAGFVPRVDSPIQEFWLTVLVGGPDLFASAVGPDRILT